MTWVCPMCSREVDGGRCVCGRFSDDSYNGIADRIGKAARRGDREEMLWYVAEFRAKLGMDWERVKEKLRDYPGGEFAFKVIRKCN